MPRASLLLFSFICVAGLDYSLAAGAQTPLVLEDSVSLVALEEFDCLGQSVQTEGKSLLQLHSSFSALEQTAMPDFNDFDAELIGSIHSNVSVLQAHEEMPDTPEAVFHAFMKEHRREYGPGSDAYHRRKKLFMKTASQIALHNSKRNQLWTAGVNKLADRTEKELQALLGWNGKASTGALAQAGGAAPSLLQINEEPIRTWGHGSSRKLPGDLSWAHLNASKRVHNQGMCGSCWAVASVSVLQAHAEIHVPQHARPLSVQELVSCVDNPHHCGGDGACDGATSELAMDYAMQYGLASPLEATAEAVKPAESIELLEQEGRCPMQARPPVLLSQWANFHSQRDTSSPGVHYGSHSPLQESRGLGMKAWERLPPNSYAPLMHALVERGPAAVAVFASKWFSYARGIFDSCEKDAVIDHAVALMGYGDDNKLGAKYWLVQNSWGPEWGEGGRIRLLRRHDDENSYCGVDSQPQEGTGCDGGPAQVKVCGMCGILYDSVVPHF